MLQPLVSYGPFDWYSVGPHVLPRSFSLVVCDGPPGDTRGGRMGLMPVLHDHLAPGCRIPVDDTFRSGERHVIEQWRRAYPALKAVDPLSSSAAERTYASLVLTDRG